MERTTRGTAHARSTTHTRSGRRIPRAAAAALLTGAMAFTGFGSSPAVATTSAVSLATAITVTSPAPVTGRVGVAYRYNVATSAGAAKWAVVSGSLPAGLVLETTGVLRGTPTTAGSSTFRLRATTVSGTVDVSYTVIVRTASGASPISVAPSSGPTAGGTTVRVPVVGGAWKQVQATSSSVLGLTDDGSVWAWGSGPASSTVPVRVLLPLPPGVRVTKIATGLNLMLAAASDGSVWTWGFGHAGDGQGARIIAKPTRVPLTLPAGVRPVGLDAGAYHSVVVASDGSVWAWGANFLAQLGDGTTTDRTRPVRVPLPAGVRAAQVDVGNNNTHVLTADGSVWSWGVNQFGALGDGTEVNRTRPVRTVVPVASGARVVQVSSGPGFGHAVASDGALYGWGYNNAGQIGDGTTVNRLAPVRVPLPTGVRLSRTGAGIDHGVGVASDGGVWWWGRVDCREGDGYCGAEWTGGTKNLVPVRHTVALPAGVKPVAADAGEWFTMVLGADGSLSGWGANTAGQLGDGTTTRRDTAVLTRSPLTITGINIGNTYATGLKRLGPSLVSVVSPPRAAGVVDVTVRSNHADGTPGPWTRMSAAWTYTG